MRQVNSPVLSIITINYNNVSGLLKTMQSVFDQTNQDFEYIVIDGGSTDGSKQSIKIVDENLSCWISEPDRGIYHAMNKGIQRATGNYLLFLNSGDVLKSSLSVGEIIPQLNNWDIVYTDLEVIFEKESCIQTFPDILSFKHFFYHSLPHPASFIKRVLFERYGNYDENLKICSDWKFFTEVICKYNVTYKHLDMVFACHFANGISSLVESKSIISEERECYLLANFPAFVDDYKYFDRLINAPIIKWLKKRRFLQ